MERSQCRSSARVWTRLHRRHALVLPRTVEELSPELKVEEHCVGDVSFLLVQDGVLLGGSKQRAFAVFAPDTDELIYAGPAHGYA